MKKWTVIYLSGGLNYDSTIKKFFSTYKSAAECFKALKALKYTVKMRHYIEGEEVQDFATDPQTIDLEVTIKETVEYSVVMTVPKNTSVGDYEDIILERLANGEHKGQQFSVKNEEILRVNTLNVT